MKIYKLTINGSDEEEKYFSTLEKIEQARTVIRENIQGISMSITELELI